MPDAKFITFEGGEGSGKSTQVKMLADYFRAQGREVVITREPGGTEAAEKIREILVAGGELGAMTEVLLNFAARTDHVENLIKPALKRGAVVICDRFFDSTYVYQGCGGGIPPEKISAIHAQAIGDFTPDLTFILDIAPEDGLQRAAARGEENRYEAKGIEYHRKVRAGFLKVAELFPARCRLVDSSQPKEQVHAAILGALSA